MAHSKAKLKSNGDRASHTRHLIPKFWTHPKHRDDSLTYRVVCPHNSWPALLVSVVYMTDKFDKSTSFPADNVMEMLPNIFFQTCFETGESECYTMEHIRVSAIEDLYSST
jgi:hypothetical protein